MRFAILLGQVYHIGLPQGLPHLLSPCPAKPFTTLPWLLFLAVVMGDMQLRGLPQWAEYNVCIYLVVFLVVGLYRVCFPELNRKPVNRMQNPGKNAKQVFPWMATPHWKQFGTNMSKIQKETSIITVLTGNLWILQMTRFEFIVRTKWKFDFFGGWVPCRWGGSGLDCGVLSG